MAVVEDLVRQISKDIIAEFFYDKHQSAYHRIPELLGAIENYTAWINGRQALNSEQTIQDLNEILVVLGEAIQARDSVLICDILEYELIPFLELNQTAVS